jgi:hypothetical protein
MIIMNSFIKYSSVTIIYNNRCFFQAATDGDKDTFRLGFRYMNVKYYLVMIPCAVSYQVFYFSFLF